MPTYVSVTLGLSLTAALTANSIGLVVLMALIPFTGAPSERIGRKLLLQAFSVFTVLLSYPLFLLVSTGAFPS